MEQKTEKILVTGAGGFIGHHLVRFLKNKGYWVRGVDLEYPEFSSQNEADEFLVLDLRDFDNCLKATKGIDKVYTLAADMGGIGYITRVNADIMRNNVLINTNMAEASKVNGIKRLFYSSSACVYPTYKQTDANVTALKESDAYPADPDNEYGWEKIFSERVYKGYQKDHGLDVRIARFHNIYGPEGTYDGGKEKAPAALSRKIALASSGDYIDIWGDGKQTRSFCYIEDCLEGVYRLMESNYKEPLNIGSDRLVSIDEMIEIISKIAGKNIGKRYQLDKPQGVRGRNSDNTLCKEVLGWQPQITLEEGLKKTYGWIEEKIKERKNPQNIVVNKNDSIDINMPVVIFCGGTGTRLKEETEFKPKPLIKIGTQPILWHIMKIFSQQGFNNFILCLGYKGEMIKDYFLRYKQLSQDFSIHLASQDFNFLEDSHKENWKVICADTGIETLTAGRLNKIKKYLEKEKRFIVTYGDGLANIDIKKLLDFHQKTGKIATITGAHPSSKYGLVETNPDKSITSFRQKPKLDEYVNIGFMVFENKIFDYLGENKMIEDIFLDLSRDNQISMYPHEDFFHAMDTYKDVEDLNKMWDGENHPWKIWEE